MKTQTLIWLWVLALQHLRFRTGNASGSKSAVFRHGIFYTCMCFKKFSGILKLVLIAYALEQIGFPNHIRKSCRMSRPCHMTWCKAHQMRPEEIEGRSARCVTSCLLPLLSVYFAALGSLPFTTGCSLSAVYFFQFPCPLFFTSLLFNCALPFAGECCAS